MAFAYVLDCFHPCFLKGYPVSKKGVMLSCFVAPRHIQFENMPSFRRMTVPGFYIHSLKQYINPLCVSLASISDQQAYLWIGSKPVSYLPYWLAVFMSTQIQSKAITGFNPWMIHYCRALGLLGSHFVGSLWTFEKKTSFWKASMIMDFKQNTEFWHLPNPSFPRHALCPSGPRPMGQRKHHPSAQWLQRVQLSGCTRVLWKFSDWFPIY